MARPILLLGALSAAMAAPPAPAFRAGCSTPPLGVEYKAIKYYSGKVVCGNLLLESDIGGTHPWVPPTVTFDTAHLGNMTSPSSLFTLIYLDPFVNVPNNGSWPDCEPACVGTKGPARHWVVGNIDAHMLLDGDLTSATTVSAFKGPSPPYGSHPYLQLLFRQPSPTPIKFTTLPSPTGIYNWDVRGFLAQYTLAPTAVASNYHITQHMDPR